MNQESIKVQFSKIKFFGKPDELQEIIALIQQEATTLIAQPDHDKEKMFALLLDLQTARFAYLMSLPTDMRPDVSLGSLMLPPRPLDLLEMPLKLN